MKITPKDILEKEFSKKFNGYDPEQVDVFLDDIIKQYELLIAEKTEATEKNNEIQAENAKLLADQQELQSEIEQAHESIRTMQAEIAEYKDRFDETQEMENKLMEVVTSAQLNATSYIEKAEVQAQKITEIANQNAKTVIESTHLRMEAAKQEIVKYEKIIDDYKKRFKLFLEEQASRIDSQLLNTSQLSTSAADISRSINSLTKQIQELDGEAEDTSIHLDDILRQSKEKIDYDFEQSAANLQDADDGANLHDILDEVIDDDEYQIED